MKTWKILCIDDDINVLNALKRSLRNENFDIIATTSPEIALKLITKNSFSTIVTDQRMPNTTGIELLEEIRKISPDSTRILLTAYNSIHVAVNAIKRGRIYRFMTKPWSDYELKVNIRESITRYELIKGIRNLKKINLEKIADPTNFIDVSHRINPQALDGINTFFIGVDHKGDILFQNQNSKITFLEYPELSSIKNISKFFPENIMKIISDSFYAKDYLVIPEFKYDRNVFWGISSSVVCQNSKKISIIILVKKIRI